VEFIIFPKRIVKFSEYKGNRSWEEKIRARKTWQRIREYARKSRKENHVKKSEEMCQEIVGVKGVRKLMEEISQEIDEGKLLVCCWGMQIQIQSQVRALGFRVRVRIKGQSL